MVNSAFFPIRKNKTQLRNMIKMSETCTQERTIKWQKKIKITHISSSRSSFLCNLQLHVQFAYSSSAKKTTWKIFAPDNTAGRGLAATSRNQNASRANVTEITTSHAFQCTGSTVFLYSRLCSTSYALSDENFSLRVGRISLP